MARCAVRSSQRDAPTSEDAAPTALGDKSVSGHRHMSGPEHHCAIGAGHITDKIAKPGAFAGD
jgi:hypothetical protein